MKDKIEDGGPAFVVPNSHYATGQVEYGTNGMTLRQYAAIHLKRPQSGLPWLDEMIEQARRDAFAGQALQGLLAKLPLIDQTGEHGVKVEDKVGYNIDVAGSCFALADAMIEAGRVK
jgi:hypothetical protein